MPRILNLALASLAAMALTGCGTGETTPPAGTPSATAPVTAVKTGGELGKVKVGDQAVCAVCAHEPGHAAAPEEAKAVLDYEGKTYAFCSVEEKAKFISAPTKYADAK